MDADLLSPLRAATELPPAQLTPPEPVPVRDAIGRRATHGVAWSAAQQVATQLLSAGVFFFLARLLHPGDFGLFAYASIAIAFVTIFLEQGFADALVQAPDVSDIDFRVVFTAGLAASLVLGAGAVAVAAFAEARLRMPGLTSLVVLGVGCLPLSALSAVQVAILRRHLHFRPLSIRQIAANVAGGIVGIVAALAGFGAYALAVQQLATALAGVMALWALGGWRPAFGWDVRIFRRHWKFAAPLYGSGFLDLVNRRADDLFIGIYLGPYLLGLYNLAYKILLTGTRGINAPFTNVGFSLFSRLQRRPAELQQAFLANTRATAALAFPLFGCLAGVAPWLIPGTLGAKWTLAVPVVQVFCLIGIIHSIAFLHGAALRAMGRTHWQMWFTLAGAGVNLIGFFVTARFGLIYVAASYVASAVLLLPVDLWLLRKALNLSLPEYLQQFVRPAWIGAGALLLGRLLATEFGRVLPPGFAGVLSGGILAGLTGWRFILPELKAFRGRLALIS